LKATLASSADAPATTMAISATAYKVLATAGPTLSVPEIAKVFGISKDTAYALAARDELGVRVLRLGRSMRIPTADVRRLLGEGREVD
jgi:excisionase family DNA binding protein